MQTCPRCSAENKDGQASCWNCWAPLEGGQAAAAPVEEAPSGRRLPLKPILVVLAVIVVAFLAYRMLGAKGPVQVASEYLDAQYNGRTSLLAQVTTPDTAATPVLPPLLQMGAYELDPKQRPELSGGRAEVSAQVSFRINGDMVKDGKIASTAVLAEKELRKSLPTRIILVRQGGKWKVDQAATRQQFVEDGLRRFRDDKAWVGELLKGKALTPPAAPAPGA